VLSGSLSVIAQFTFGFAEYSNSNIISVELHHVDVSISIK
jgi:hypothetical protein